jgi:hypothetical protein
MGRSLPVPVIDDPADPLPSYLSADETRSAKALAAKAAVLIVPADRAGEIIWPDQRLGQRRWRGSKRDRPPDDLISDMPAAVSHACTRVSDLHQRPEGLFGWRR